MRLSLMLDCSRNAVFNVPTLKRFIDVLSRMGYNSLYLYIEDTYEIDDEPYFGRFRGRYSKEELKELDAYALSKNIELVPCIQTLAHLNQIFRWKKYQHINDTNDIILCDDPKSYELIDKMFKTIKECFTTNKLHIGCDEAHNIGRGKFLDKNGYENCHDIFLRHLLKVNNMALSYGFEVEMWSDMAFRFANNGQYSPIGLDEKKLSEIAKQIPENIKQVFWAYYAKGDEYYDKMFGYHKKYFKKSGFAGGTLSWFGYAPMNKINMQISEQAIKGIKEHGVEDVMVTMWFDSGAQSSIWAYLPSLYYYAERLLNNSSNNDIKKKFDELFGISFDTMLLLDLPNNLGNEDIVYLTNPSFFMLYSDYFSGSFDYTVKKEGTMLYNIYYKELSKYKSNSQFGYVFNELALLCKVLSIKYDLGVRTREAYKNNDVKTLKKLVRHDYSKLIGILEKLSNSLNVLWINEHKTSGLEIENIHLGGLIERTKTCIVLLKKHLKNKMEIVELKEDNLPFYCGEVPDDMPVCSSQYELSASVNVLTH